MRGIYWYLITILYCPVCGRQKVMRERQYTPKPVTWEERYRTLINYDYCMERGG